MTRGNCFFFLLEVHKLHWNSFCLCCILEFWLVLNRPHILCPKWNWDHPSNTDHFCRTMRLSNNIAILPALLLTSQRDIFLKENFSIPLQPLDPVCMSIVLVAKDLYLPSVKLNPFGHLHRHRSVPVLSHLIGWFIKLIPSYALISTCRHRIKTLRFLVGFCGGRVSLLAITLTQVLGNTIRQGTNEYAQGIYRPAGGKHAPLLAHKVEFN